VGAAQVSLEAKAGREENQACDWKYYAWQPYPFCAFRP